MLLLSVECWIKFNRWGRAMTVGMHPSGGHWVQLCKNGSLLTRLHSGSQATEDFLRGFSIRLAITCEYIRYCIGVPHSIHHQCQFPSERSNLFVSESSPCVWWVNLACLRMDRIEHGRAAMRAHSCATKSLMTLEKQGPHMTPYLPLMKMWQFDL